MEKNSSLNDLMRSTLDRVREMADVNTIVGKPITTLKEMKLSIDDYCDGIVIE